MAHALHKERAFETQVCGHVGVRIDRPSSKNYVFELKQTETLRK